MLYVKNVYFEKCERYYYILFITIVSITIKYILIYLSDISIQVDQGLPSCNLYANKKKRKKKKWNDNPFTNV